MIMHTGCDRPALKLLNKHVRNHVCFRWFDLGVELLEQADEELLNEIDGEDLTESCTKMFQLWLKKCPNASWNQLIQALKEIEFLTVPERIEGMLMPTEDTVGVSAGMLNSNYC